MTELDIIDVTPSLLNHVITYKTWTKRRRGKNKLDGLKCKYREKNGEIERGILRLWPETVLLGHIMRDEGVFATVLNGTEEGETRREKKKLKMTDWLYKGTDNCVRDLSIGRIPTVRPNNHTVQSITVSHK